MRGSSVKFPRSASTKEQPLSDAVFLPPRLSATTVASLSSTRPRFTPDTSKLELDPTAYRCISSVLKKDGQILCIAAANGLVYTGSQGNTVRVWKLPEFTECGQLKTKACMVVALQVSNDRVYAAYADCKIRMKHLAPISSLAFNTSDDILYSASLDKTVKVWRISDFKCVETIQAHPEPINAIALADDGVLYTASDDATVRVWRRNFCSGARPHSLTVTLPTKFSPVKTLALTSDGGVLYGGCTDGYVHYWLKGWFSGQLQYGGALQGHTHAVMCLASVANYVASGSADSTSRVWVRELDGLHKCIAVLQGHRGPIRCITAFMGRATDESVEEDCTVCTGSLDGVLKVWRVRNTTSQTREPSQNNPAIAAGGESRMLACSSLFRANFRAWKSTNICVKSKFSLYFQKYKFCHGLSFDLKMDIRKGKQVHIDRRKRKVVTQAWRPVSTQPTCSEGDGEKVKLQNPVEEVHYAISSTVSTSISEDTNSESLNEAVGPDPCPQMESSNSDISLDGKIMPSEKHSVSMEIGGSLMRFIKGKGGGIQEEIEKEAGVKIIFPSSKKEDSIIIEGNSAESLTKASEKIQTIIDKAVNSRTFDYSHFVSLPLAIHPGLVEKLVIFQNTILGMAASDKDKNLDSDTGGDTSDDGEDDQHSIEASRVSIELKAEEADAHVKVNIMSDQQLTDAPRVTVELEAEDADRPVKVNLTNIPLVSYCPKESRGPAEETSSKKKESGIERSIFIKPKTFHLTVLMLKLWNKERVKAAAEVLQSVSSKVVEVLENRPVSIRLKGLDCMRGSLAKARVVYAPVEEIGSDGRLLRACQVIIDAFVEAGLVNEKDAQQKLKLHATLMNARHRKRKKKTRKLDSFDARGIFDLYGSEEWGEYLIREAHLSQRFVFDENGYYHCCASIPFPVNMQVE
ncbi:UNVERIFIED_CONTAM: protein JINGUBANG [Sesamum latifolium]|uniref:Protein JINGUBANG n=1 Tax=Sesamum latifolium TaxID=2727402 RepID=A0AAW2UF28_9LAMI